MRRLNMEFMLSWWNIVTDDGTPMIDEVNTNFEIWEQEANTHDCAGLRTENGELLGPQKRVREGYRITEATYRPQNFTDGAANEKGRHGFFRNIIHRFNDIVQKMTI